LRRRCRSAEHGRDRPQHRQRPEHQAGKQQPPQAARHPLRVLGGHLEHRYHLEGDADDQDADPAEQAPAGMQVGQHPALQVDPGPAVTGEQPAAKQRRDREGDDRQAHAEHRGVPSRSPRQAQRRGQQQARDRGREQDDCHAQQPGQVEREAEGQRQRAGRQQRVDDGGHHERPRHRRTGDHRQHLQQRTEHHHRQHAESQQVG
jgi:hypothetical protein